MRKILSSVQPFQESPAFGRNRWSAYHRDRLWRVRKQTVTRPGCAVSLSEGADKRRRYVLRASWRGSASRRIRGDTQQPDPHEKRRCVCDRQQRPFPVKGCNHRIQRTRRRGAYVSAQFRGIHVGLSRLKAGRMEWVSAVRRTAAGSKFYNSGSEDNFSEITVRGDIYFGYCRQA